MSRLWKCYLVLLSFLVSLPSPGLASDTSADIADKLRAVQSLESKFKDNPKQWSSDMSTALFHLATSYFRDKKFAEAKAAYIRSNEIDEKTGGSPSAVSLVGAGQSCLQLKQYAEAEKYLDKALVLVQKPSDSRQGISPAAAGVLTGLAQVYENTNRVDKADKTYRQVSADVLKKEAGMVQCISSPGAFDALAQFLERQGKPKEAEEWYARVAKLRANAHAYGVQSECLKHYAAMLRKQKRVSEAVAIERRADELSATNTKMNKSGLDY